MVSEQELPLVRWLAAQLDMRRLLRVQQPGDKRERPSEWQAVRLALWQGLRWELWLAQSWVR